MHDKTDPATKKLWIFRLREAARPYAIQAQAAIQREIEKGQDNAAKAREYDRLLAWLLREEVYQGDMVPLSEQVQTIISVAIASVADPGDDAEGADLPALQRMIGEWSIATFGQADNLIEWEDRWFRHLQEEIEEFRAEMAQDDFDPDALAGEAADIAILILAHAHRMGYSLRNHILRKHRINQSRQWEETPGAKGYRKHVEPAAVHQEIAAPGRAEDQARARKSSGDFVEIPKEVLARLEGSAKECAEIVAYLEQAQAVYALPGEGAFDRMRRSIEHYQEINRQAWAQAQTWGDEIDRLGDFLHVSLGLPNAADGKEVVNQAIEALRSRTATYEDGHAEGLRTALEAVRSAGARTWEEMAAEKQAVNGPQDAHSAPER